MKMIQRSSQHQLDFNDRTGFIFLWKQSLRYFFKNLVPEMCVVYLVRIKVVKNATTNHTNIFCLKR